MSEPNEAKRPATITPKGLPASKMLWGTACGALLVLVLGMVSYKELNKLNQRMTQLEQTQNTLLSQDEVSLLRDALTAQQKQLTELQNRQVQFTPQLVALNSQGALIQELQEQLKTQQVELNVLSKDLQRLKIPPSPLFWPLLPTTVSNAKISLAPVKSPVSKPKPVSRVARKPPFVLTGVEQRGTTAFAAVAPPGFSELSQIQLIGEGESVAGWQLISAGFGQARFRINGHLHTLNVQ